MYYLNMSFVQQQCTVITPLMTCLSPVRVAGDGRVKSPLLGPSHLHRHPPSAREVNMSGQHNTFVPRMIINSMPQSHHARVDVKVIICTCA